MTSIINVAQENKFAISVNLGIVLVDSIGNYTGY